MTVAPVKHDSLASAIDEMATQLYPEADWDFHRSKYEKVGINYHFHDMQCETFEAVYDQQPELFDGCQWINSSDGLPLWVRPGVKWIPDYDH